MQIRDLPKAKLLSVKWSWRYFYFARFRLANALRLQIGWMTVEVRRPWLERSARTLHPECFSAAP